MFNFLKKKLKVFEKNLEAEIEADWREAQRARAQATPPPFVLRLKARGPS